MSLKLTPELIEQLDKIAPSPAELASKVFNELKDKCPELTNQELQCFAVEYLASQVATGELGFAKEEIKRMTQIYYLAHYYRVSCLPQVTGSNSNIPETNTYQDLMKEDESFRSGH